LNQPAQSLDQAKADARTDFEGFACEGISIILVQGWSVKSPKNTTFRTKHRTHCYR